ncbi:hypothetical protein Dfri01_07840 [Dyadobacter frigoris]|nr:hypothetical protein Dfri01_07840 [Dyadobacter frigoris]
MEGICCANVIREQKTGNKLMAKNSNREERNGLNLNIGQRFSGMKNKSGFQLGTTIVKKVKE